MASDNEDVVDAESTDITADDTPIQSDKLKKVENLDEQELLAVEAAIMTNNYAGLSVSQRMAIVVKRCEALKVDPAQGPFVWGVGDKGKRMLIATKNLSQQLRSNRNLKCEPVEDWSQAPTLGILMVRCTVTDPQGRSDMDIGVVSIKNKQGDGLANAIMGAFTKAKNRATLSLCGVGGLDESEMAAIRAEQSQRLFQAEPQGMRRVEPGPNQMNQGLLLGANAVQTGDGTLIPVVAPPRVSKTGMPFARDLVKAGKGEPILEDEQQTLSGDGEGKQPLKPTPLPVTQPPPPGRVITARPPGLVKAGGPAPQLGNPPQRTSTANPPAPRPPKASPVKAGGPR